MAYGSKNRRQFRSREVKSNVESKFQASAVGGSVFWGVSLCSLSPEESEAQKVVTGWILPWRREKRWPGGALPDVVHGPSSNCSWQRWDQSSRRVFPSRSRKVIEYSTFNPSISVTTPRWRPKNQRNVASRPQLPPRQLSRLLPTQHLMNFLGATQTLPPCHAASLTLLQGGKVSPNLPRRCRGQHRDDRTTQDYRQGGQYATRHYLGNAWNRKDDQCAVSSSTDARRFVQRSCARAQCQ